MARKRVGTLQRVLSRRVESLVKSVRCGQVTEDEVYHAFGMQSPHTTPARRGFYRLHLCSAGNPDLGQRCKLSPSRDVDFETLRECRDAVLEYIAGWNLGSGNWGFGAGVVRDADGTQLGSFSYNGCFWLYGTVTKAVLDEHKELEREAVGLVWDEARNVYVLKR